MKLPFEPRFVFFLFYTDKEQVQSELCSCIMDGNPSASSSVAQMHFVMLPPPLWQCTSCSRICFHGYSHGYNSVVTSIVHTFIIQRRSSSC